jgi:hypothetical protein
MTFRQRLAALVVAFAATLAVSVAAAGTATAAPSTGAATPQARTAAVSAPVTGTLPGGGSFAGTYTVNRFLGRQGQLLATGTLSGTLTDAAGNVIGTVTQAPVQNMPVAVQATCEILHLDLGPLDLNLLGLMVHLDRVVLDISAQQAPGNLLGNLLCAVAHLLDHNNPSTGALAAILNRILALLG